MKTTLSAVFFTLVLSFAPAGLQAQSPEPAPRQHDFVAAMTARLGLSAGQQSQAATIFNNARSAESAVRASLKTAQQSLDDAIKSNNTVSIEQLSNTIGTLTAQMTSAESKAYAAFYQILTPEQRNTFDQVEGRRFTRFRNGARPGMRPNGQ